MGKGLVADVSLELSEDGCVTFPCVESQHAGTYNFIASNSAGTVEGSITLVVQERREGRESEEAVAGNRELVAVDQLGVYVADHHKQENAGFLREFQVRSVC